MTQGSGLGPVAEFNATDFLIFYEIIDGNLVRSMQPLDLAYRQSSGAGRDLICLHSLSGASTTFAQLAVDLHETADVIALDQRGFGKSRRPTHEYSVELWVEDAEKLMLSVGCAAPVVYGHGFGACVAVALADQGLVSGAALSGVAFAPGEPRALEPIAAAGDEGDEVAIALAEFTGGRVLSEDLTPQIVARAVRAWQAFDGTALPERIDVPVIVMGGEDDELTPIDADGGGAWFADQVGGRLVRMPGGHEVPVEEPVAVAETLGMWLETV